MKTEKALLRIKDYTAMDMAVASDEGDKICQQIKCLFSKYEVIILDFSDINLLTSAFLNAAIGQLYKDFTSEVLSSRLKLQNVSAEDLPLFKKVTDRAKEYYKDTTTFSQIVKGVLNGE